MLVTGASGFIGRQTLAPLVSAGFDVHAIGHAAEHDAEGVRWHRGDLLSPDFRRAVIEAVAPTHLLHAAWTLTPGRYLSSADNLDWLAASVLLLRQFAEQGGRRALCVGTCFEYDLHAGVCDEATTPCKPATLYATAKHSLYRVSEAYAGSAGLSLAWARPFFLYGPHEHPRRLVSSIVRALLLGERAPCSHGRQVRDFLHVSDLGEALAVLAGSEVTGAVNVASGLGVAVGDIALGIARRLGREDLLDIGAVPVPADDPPLVVADVTRMTDRTGWRARRSLDQGLDETIEWWRSAIAKPA
jgi:nucleoside-diphosphate-sugar epimerase